MPRIILAPLQGVTTPLFRTIFATHFSGCSEAVAPFITTSSGKSLNRQFIKEVLPENNTGNLLLVPQLLSRNGADFVATAKYICSETNASEINWNIGCPSGTVTGKRRGAGLLPYPDEIDGFLDYVAPRMPCSLSVKMRLGMKSAREWEKLVPVLNRYPIKEITIHARTGVQKYSGCADIDMFAEIKSALAHSVVYNGDITTVTMAEQVFKKHPDIGGIMVGRGLIANPLLASSIQIGQETDKGEMALAICKLHDLLFVGYGTSMQGGALLGRMKELMKYWGSLLSGNERDVRNVLRARSVNEYEKAVDYIMNR